MCRCICSVQITFLFIHYFLFFSISILCRQITSSSWISEPRILTVTACNVIYVLKRYLFFANFVLLCEQSATQYSFLFILFNSKIFTTLSIIIFLIAKYELKCFFLFSISLSTNWYAIWCVWTGIEIHLLFEILKLLQIRYDTKLVCLFLENKLLCYIIYYNEFNMWFIKQILIKIRWYIIFRLGIKFCDACI